MDTPAPNTKAAGWPVGSALLWIGAAVFVASMVAGLARSIMAGHWLPPVGVEYTTELDALIAARGSAAALPEIRAAARIDFDNEQVVNRLLRHARQAGQQDDVTWALVALARLKPEDGQIRTELAAALLAQHRLEDAFAQARFAIWLTPNSADAHCVLGATLRQLGQPQQAAMAYGRALEIDPSSADARQGLQRSRQGS